MVTVEHLPLTGVSGWLPLPVGLVHLIAGVLYGGTLWSPPDPAVHRPGESGSCTGLSGARGEWLVLFACSLAPSPPH